MRAQWSLDGALPWSDEEVARLVRVEGKPCEKLRQLSPATAENMLRNAMAAIYVPTERSGETIRRVLTTARVHLDQYYPDRVAYLRGLNAPKSPLQPTDAVCITGLAGVGKSALANAILRLLRETLMVDPGSGYPEVGFEFIWHVVVEARRALRDLLRGPLNGRLIDLDSIRSEARLVERASVFAFRHGICLLLFDEWQFITAGTQANALLTKLLHSLRYIGVPFFYIANYSLCRRLMKRPSEDQHRLIHDPIIILPDEPETPAILDLYKQYCTASNGALLLEPKALIEQIHDYTQGVNRCRISLLASAYRISHDRRADRVNSKDLEAAFRADSFSLFRRESQHLRTQALTGRQSHIDTWCPFVQPMTPRGATAQSAREHEEAAVMQQAAISSFTPMEAEGYQRLVPQSPPVSASRQKASLPKVTLEGLLEGAERFRKQQAKGSKT